MMKTFHAPALDGSWNTWHFGVTGNLPREVGRLTDWSMFSRHLGARYLDMCIYQKGKWHIPLEIRQWTEAIRMAADFEKTFAPLEYVYITIDQKPVPPDQSQRRGGWHSDAYLTNWDGVQVDVVAENVKFFKSGEPIERTYVAYDNLPTIFADGPWTVGDDPENCEVVLQNFEQRARGKRWWLYPSYTVLCLTPYCVHQSMPNLMGSVVPRTFIKIQFSRHRYNREGNSLNPEIDYSDWTWVPRNAEKREHRYADE